MSKKIGRIIAFGDDTLSILEEGGGNKVYKFSPRKVKGNLYEHDDQCLDYPARLCDKLVKFNVDKDDVVTSVSVLTFRKSMCENCFSRPYTLAAKRCECGNTANSIFKQCEACAVENGECARCGTRLK